MEEKKNQLRCGQAVIDLPLVDCTAAATFRGKRMNEIYARKIFKFFSQKLEHQ